MNSNHCDVGSAPANEGRRRSIKEQQSRTTGNKRRIKKMVLQDQLSCICF